MWQVLGGQNAITDETEALWLIEHAIVSVAHAQGGGKGKRPEPRPYPKSLAEKAADEAKKARNRARAKRFAEAHPD